MLMTDDLHDIDDLFREGIEGHEEEVPSSVWEAVSNDLDKKQASYYKNKYHRLKKASLLLLLLCFLGGLYIFYKTTGGKETAPLIKNPAPVLTEGSAPSDARKNGRSVAVSEEKGPENLLGQEKENAPAKDSASVSLPRETAKEEGQIRERKAPKTAISKKSRPEVKTGSVASASLPTARRKREGLTTMKRSPTAKYREQRYNQVADLQTPAYPSPLHMPLLLPVRNHAARGLNLQSLPATPRRIVPQSVSVPKSKAKTAHGFLLTAFVAPNVSFERLEDNGRLAGPGRNRQEAHREEQENYSFSAGLLLSYNLTDKLSLQSGLSVTSSSIAVAPKTVYAKADNNGQARYELHCSSGYAYINPKSGVQLSVGDSAQTSGTTSGLTYLSVPAFISHRFGKGRFSLLPVVGVGLNFLISGKTTTSLSNRAGSESATTPITGLKSTYVDGHFGIGIEYDLSKKFSIGVRPNARLALMPINKETPVQAYQNFLSLETGVRIKL